MNFHMKKCSRLKSPINSQVTSYLNCTYQENCCLGFSHRKVEWEHRMHYVHLKTQNM